MKRYGESGTGLKWVLIGWLVGVLLMLFLSEVEAKEAPKVAQKSIIVNKDGSITMPKEMWEMYAKHQLQGEALLDKVYVENMILRKQLEDLINSKCVKH